MPYLRRIAPRRKPRAGRLKGPALAELRQQCFDRDGWKCQIFLCDVYEAPHWPRAEMAHIKAKRMSGDSLGNVRTLCSDCHADSHRGTKGGKFQHEKQGGYDEFDEL